MKMCSPLRRIIEVESDMVLERNIKIDREQIAEFCRRNHIRRLALFGSVLRDDFRPDSDVDVLVEFKPGARTGLAFFRMQRELSEIIGRPVDLNTKGFLGPRLYPKVEPSLEVLYSGDRP